MKKYIFWKKKKQKVFRNFWPAKFAFGGVKNTTRIGGEEPENDCFGFFYTFKNIYISKFV